MTHNLTTGIGTLDDVLGGGLRPGSLLVIGGGPGTGKTILAQQICFANIRADRPALYYTTLSEPHSKLVEHLEPFAFFDSGALDEHVRFIHLAGLLTEDDEGLRGVADEIVRSAFDAHPSVIVVDSSKALHDYAQRSELRSLIYDLASRIAHSNALLVFVGEYTAEEFEREPEFAVADSIIQVALEPYGASDRRWLRVLKRRGARHMPGKHSFEIDTRGIALFPRLEAILQPGATARSGRCATGIAQLDEMVDGGLPRGDSTFVSGPTGVGKTVLSLHFVHSGLANREGCLYLTFQETEEDLAYKAAALGLPIDDALGDGSLRVHHVPPVDVNLDEIGGILTEAIEATPTDRVVIDSLAELVFSGERERLPAYSWALGGFVAAAGATLLVTNDATSATSPGGIGDLGFLFDNVVRLRYVDMGQEMGRALRVEKLRRSDHDKRELMFKITGEGLQLEI